MNLKITLYKHKNTFIWCNTSIISADKKTKTVYKVVFLTQQQEALNGVIFPKGQKNYLKPTKTNL